jgi:O-antigen/teichoic acid export membrane protein
VANAGYLWGVQVVSGVVGFVFWGLATRLYLPEDVGTSSAVISAAQLLAGLAGFGVGQGLVRFLPGAASPVRLLNGVFTLNASASLLFASGYLFGLRVWSPSLGLLRQSIGHSISFALYVAATSLSTAVQMAFVAERRSSYALIQTCVAQGGRMVLLVALVRLGAAGVIGSVAVPLSLAVVLSVTVFLPRIEYGYRPRLHLDSKVVHLLPYALGNYVAVMMLQSVQMVIPLLALEMLGAASSGYAYVGWMVGALLTSPGLALANSAFAEGSHAPSLLRAILVRAAGLGLTVTVPCALLVGFLAPWLLSLLFGAAYVPETVPLVRWLALAAPLTVLARLYLTYLRVEKKISQLVLLGGLIAAITLGTSALGMSAYGIAASGFGWMVANASIVCVASVLVLGRQRGSIELGPEASVQRGEQPGRIVDRHGRE